MRDLFGSTKYIKIGELETILRSSEAMKELFYFERINKKYTFLDYVSNLDSYLYGVILLKVSNVSEVLYWICNFLENLYIPLIKSDDLFIVKSKLISEIMKIKKDNSKIHESIRDYIKSDIYTKIEKIIIVKQGSLKSRLLDSLDLDIIVELLCNYYAIYNDKLFIKDVYVNNAQMRKKLKLVFDFLE